MILKCTTKKKKHKCHLQKTLDNLMKQTNPDPNAIYTVENEIKNYEINDLEKSRIRIHIAKMTEEKPSKLFLGMEKQRCNDNTLNFLKDKDGKYYTDSISMSKYVNLFYQDLYSADNIEYNATQDILNTVTEVNLPDDVIEDLESPIREN